MQGLGNVVTLAAHVVLDRRVYLLAGIAPANQFEAAQGPMTRTIRSFRSLSAAEAADIRPNRVDIYTVRGGDSWESIARRGGDVIKPSTLAIMNNHDPGQPPQAGDRIKIVVAG
jgi:predicted Zn-dependent protease